MSSLATTPHDPSLHDEVLALRELSRDLQAQLSMAQVELDETNRGVLALYAELDDQAEELRRAKRVSETRFLAVYRHAPCGIALLDGDGLILETNPALEALLGRSAAALGARALREFADPQWGSALDAVGRPASGTISHQEVNMRRGDGSGIRLEWGATAEIEDGLTLALAMDVSQRAELEALRAQWLERERSARGEAEHASRQKDDFISILAHELRGPLSVVSGWAQVFRRASPEGMRKGVDAIERACATQSRMITDLLDMSRLRLGKLAMTFSEIDPSAEVTHALEALRATADKAGVALEVDMAGAPPRAQADQSRLQQVVWNLASNAIKFTPRGGHVRTRVSRAGDMIRIEFTDTGQGMPPDFLPRVFERFSQSDAATNRQRGGLGLGLSIVKQIVEAHGGTISASSAGIGLGSTFAVELPLSQVPGSGHVAPSTDAAAVPLAGLDILMVDDDEDSLEVLATVLEDRGATARAASDAESALAMISARRPDILVSDIGMPGKDGYALIREMRLRDAAHGYTRMPAIALTAFARDEDRREALAAGFDAHCSKPMRPMEIVRQIALLAQREEAPPGDG
jgi:PAS domain S-box-containing protein